MRRWMLALVLAGISTTACGDDPPQCLLDTDCPLGQRCAEEKCVQRGAPARRDSGTVGEGGVADVGPLPDTGIPPVVDMGFPPPFDSGFPPPPPPVDMGSPTFDGGPLPEGGLPDSGPPMDGAAGETGARP